MIKIDRENHNPLLILFVSVALFVLCYSCTSLDEPESGPFKEAAVVSLQMLRNIPCPPYSVNVLGRNLAWTIDGKHGALETYIYLPFIAIGGPTLGTVRIAALLFGILAIVATFIFGKIFFDLRVGAAAALLLAVNPFFVDLIRERLVGFSIPFFSVMATMFFFLYQDSRKRVYLCLWMVFLGLGLNAKAFFIWFILAFMVVGWLVYFRKNRINFTHVVLGAGTFCLTIFPLLFFWWKTNFIERFVSQRLVITPNGVDNRLYWAHVLERWGHVKAVILGDAIGTGGLRDVVILLFCVLILVLIIRLVFLRDVHKLRDRIVFLLLLTFFVIIASGYTFTSLHPKHMNIVFPYLQILIAVACWEIWQMCIDRRFFGRMAIAAVFIVFLVSYGRKDFLDCLERRREAINNAQCSTSLLKDWLIKKKFYKVTLLNAHESLLSFLSDLRVQVESVGWGPHGREELIRGVETFKPEDILVFTRIDNAEGSNEELGRKFYDTVKAFNRKIVVHKEFRRADGTIKYLVCSLE